MSGLFDELDDVLEDDDYVDDYDDEHIELDSELGTDYHEVRNVDNSISRATEYLHPELTIKSSVLGGGSYVPIPKAAKRTLPGDSVPQAPIPGFITKKLPAKLRHKHGIRHIVIRHKNGKRTLLV